MLQVSLEKALWLGGFYILYSAFSFSAVCFNTCAFLLIEQWDTSASLLYLSSSLPIRFFLFGWLVGFFWLGGGGERRRGHSISREIENLFTFFLFQSFFVSCPKDL